MFWKKWNDEYCYCYYCQCEWQYRSVTLNVSCSHLLLYPSRTIEIASTVSGCMLCNLCRDDVMNVESAEVSLSSVYRPGNVCLTRLEISLYVDQTKSRSSHLSHMCNTLIRLTLSLVIISRRHFDITVIPTLNTTLEYQSRRACFCLCRSGRLEPTTRKHPPAAN